MLFLKDKLLILVLTLSVYWYFENDTPIVPILCTIIISGLNTYYKKPLFRLISVISYIFFYTLDPHFIYFSPVLMYDIAHTKESRLLYTLSTFCLLSTIYLELYTFSDLIPNFLLYGISIYLKIKSTALHDLHDESLDLETELHKLVDDFNFCHINFDYDITHAPNNEVKYSFIAIVKEALANVMKHSHATDVEVIANEHPTFYQLIIQDNDLSTSVISSSGIGLHNMEQRISNLDGQLSIDTTKGFKIFITVPKKKGNMS